MPATRQWEGIETPAPGRWTIDRARVEFVAGYELGRLRGRFHEVAGSMDVAEHPEESRLEVAIDAASVDTGIWLLDRVLRTRPFLNARRHPYLWFRTRRVTRTGETSLRVVGDLTVRRVTRPVALDVRFRGMEGGPGGAPAARFSAAGEVDRAAFGFGWSHILGVPLRGRRVRVELEIAATPAERPG